MISLPWIFKLNNYISYFLSVHRLFLKCNSTIYFISKEIFTMDINS